MSERNWNEFEQKQLSGRNRRLLKEWILLDKFIAGRAEMNYRIVRRNLVGLPMEYLITYQLRSISGVKQIDCLNQHEVVNTPVFSSTFYMRIHIPDNYPSIDAPIDFRFLCQDEEGISIPHPWHPNIRYFGEFAGRVCLNSPNTFVSLAWCVERVGLYLRYELYHAWQEPPYPEDPKVAEWVIKQGEPNEWVFFDQVDMKQD